MHMLSLQNLCLETSTANTAIGTTTVSDSPAQEVVAMNLRRWCLLRSIKERGKYSHSYDKNDSSMADGFSSTTIPGHKGKGYIFSYETLKFLSGKKHMKPEICQLIPAVPFQNEYGWKFQLLKTN